MWFSIVGIVLIIFMPGLLVAVALARADRQAK